MTSHLTDFGQTIGGARKHQPHAKRTKVTATADKSLPVWRRKYEVVPYKDAYMLRRNGSLLYQQTFPNEATAETAIPLVEICRKHRVSPSRKIRGQYSIYKQINQRQWAEIKAGFSTEQEAKTYMVSNIPTILAFRSSDPERPHLDKLTRKNATRPLTTVTTSQFQSTFAFRGGQFGNWNLGGDGQAALNQGYWALWDLAEILDVAPATIALDRDLSIAFGARGHGGKNANAAHYERAWGIINLTKLKGHGTLAHEFGHALDHWLGRRAGYASSERTPDGQFRTKSAAADYLSNHLHLKNNKLSLSLNTAFAAIMDTICYKQTLHTPDPINVTKQLTRYRNDLSEKLEYLTQRWLDGAYNKRYKAPTAAQKTEWETATALLRSEQWGEKIVAIPAKGLHFDTMSHAPLQTLEQLFYAAQLRHFIKTDSDSEHARIVTLIRLIEVTKQELARAEAGITQPVKVKTDYYNAARDLDATRSDPYYTTPHEMFARAFEAFIQDEFADRDRTSDYLVYGASNQFYMDSKPYPEGKEREAINRCFRAFFAVLREKIWTARNITVSEKQVADSPLPTSPLPETLPIHFTTQPSLFQDVHHAQLARTLRVHH